MNCVCTPYKAYISICLGIVLLLLNGCLSRKNALPPDRVPVAYGKKHKGTIPTDASSTAKNSRKGPVGTLDRYADFLGVKPNTLQTPSLYAYIDEWMGTPHRYGGNDRQGIDCSAFVGLVMRDVYGKPVPRVSKDMAGIVKRKNKRRLQEGDLVFFAFGRNKIDHVGIYLHNNKFVHVSTSKGIIISDLHDPWYKKYFRRAGTVR